MTGEDRSAPAGADPEPPVTPEPGAPEPGAADAVTAGMDDVLGREVALVTLPPVSGPALDDRVDRIRRLARLHHPHLLEVYDVDGLGDDAEHVLVLERGAGRPLDEITADAPLPLRRVAEIGARVASALAQAHRHGVVHGRLGPASVLVEDDQHVWLVGLTASLQDEPSAPAAEAPAVADDLRALAWTLARAVDPAEADELAVLLAEAREGRGSADELSGRLLRRARRDAAPTDTAGFAAAAAAPRPSPVALRRVTARSLAGSGSVAGGAPVSAVPAAGPASPARTAPPAPGGRRAGGLVGRGARLATLAAVALLLGLTSGVLIWGQETRNWFGAARSAPEAAAPAAPPVAVPPAATTAGAPTGSGRDGSRESGDTSRSDGESSASSSARGAAPVSAGTVLPPPAVTPRPPAPSTAPPATRPTTPTTPTTRPTTPTTRPTTPPSTAPSTTPETSTSPATTASSSRGTTGRPGDDGESADAAGSGTASRA